MRDARSDRIHALLLRRYVSDLSNRGHLQEFFIEGGRSRSGRMRQPRLGLLNTIVSAFLKGTKRDLLFVPVSITYENVVEDRTFGEENTGRSKPKENLLALLRARKIFSKSYGEVILNFGKPISLSKFVQENDESNPGSSKLSDERSLVQSLAATLSQRIRSQINISLTGLSYSALLMAPSYGLTRIHLLDSIRRHVA